MILKIPLKHGGMKDSSTDKAPDRVMEIVSKEFGTKYKVVDVSVCQDFLKNEEEIEKAVPSWFFIGIGGDHSITYSLIKGTKKKPVLVMVDAHPDCEHGFETVTNEDFVRRLVENKIVSGVVMLGTRRWSKEEMDFMRKNNIISFQSSEIMLKGIKSITEDVMGLLKGKEFYLSIDMDGVDPAFAPGVAWPEPGGLFSREIMYFVKKLKKLGGMIGADLVEVDPDRDVNSITVKLAATILHEIID
jgi:agmatinase